MALTASIIRDSLVGGVLIGTAAAGLILVNGRVAGISGIFGAAIKLRAGLWRYAFLAGLIGSPFLVPLLGIAPVVPHHQTGLIGLALAGLLVGVGTRLSSGCTSGHGVCGLANLSLRSLVATLVFMIVAAGTVFLVRHGHALLGAL
jgi:Predicted transporter component